LKALEYLNTVTDMAKQVIDTQLETIDKAAELTAKTLAREGMIYTFGTGHSHILAEEIFDRAGGLVKVYPILDEPLMLHTAAVRSGRMENLPGYAEILIDNNLGIKKGDLIFLFSNSGRNGVVIEMAMAARARGMVTICVTNMTHSKSIASRHASGKKLYEVCDLAIDNRGVTGDACVPIGRYVCGATSTVIGSMIMHAVVCGTVEKLLEYGAVPEIFISGNVDEGEAENQRYIAKYNGQIKIL
jgi:uncharacterized phosphosugar-binding protein